MKRFLLPLLAVALPLAAVADPPTGRQEEMWAHDLTDPRVQGFSTSVELQVHHDKLLIDLWMQFTDLSALKWRQAADETQDVAPPPAP